MIKPEIYYEVTCDECGEQFSDGDTIIAFESQKEAVETVFDAGWRGVEHKGLNMIVCPDCLERLTKEGGRK